MICSSGGSKSRLARAAGAEPAGQMRHEKVHAVMARRTFPSQNGPSTRGADHFWKLRCRKSARRCGAKYILKSKCTKHTMVGTTFGSCDVEKVHAVVARTWSDHFWKLRCRKSARRCGAKHISKSKCTKHHMFAPLLESEISNFEKVHAVVARSTFPSRNVQNATCSRHFWRFRYRSSLHYSTLHSTTLRSTTLHYTTLHNTTTTTTQLHSTTLNYTTLHYITLHYITLHCTTFHYTKLHYTTLHYTTTTQLHSTTIHSTTLHYTKLHYTTLHSTTLLHYITLHYLPLHFTTLHYTTLHYTTTTTTQLHSTTLHYTKLHYTTLHYTTLHSTTLHYTTPHYTTLHYTEWHCTTDRQVDR